MSLDDGLRLASYSLSTLNSHCQLSGHPTPKSKKQSQMNADLPVSHPAEVGRDEPLTDEITPYSPFSENRGWLCFIGGYR